MINFLWHLFTLLERGKARRSSAVVSVCERLLGESLMGMLSVSIRLRLSLQPGTMRLLPDGVALLLLKSGPSAQLILPEALLRG